jgi:hypothetical protein
MSIRAILVTIIGVLLFCAIDFVIWHRDHRVQCREQLEAGDSFASRQELLGDGEQ